MTKLSDDTIDKLRQVQKAILANPTHIDMDTFISAYDCSKFPHTTKVNYALLVGPGCDTVGCIAGFTVGVFDPAYTGGFTNTAGKASQILGLDRLEVNGLFYLNHWPDDLREEYMNAALRRNHVKMAEIVANRIDAYIESDGDDAYYEEDE